MSGSISFSGTQEKVVQKTGASSITNSGFATRRLSHFQEYLRGAGWQNTEHWKNWVSFGLLEQAKGALNPEKPLSLEHWLDSLGFASALYGVSETAKQAAALRRTETSIRAPSQQAPLLEGGSGTRYTPANPGPLSQNVAETFTGGSYTETVLTKDTTFYRVYGGDAGRVGRYLSRTPQSGGMQSQMDLALNPDWGNTAEYVTKVVVPKGTTIYEGTAAAQIINGGAGTLSGGGSQVYIPEVNASWFGN